MGRRDSFGGTNVSLLTSAGSGRWWTWATAAARTAQAVSASDVGMVGYQSDIAMHYRLLGVSPTRWGMVLPDGVGPVHSVVAPANTAALNANGLDVQALNGTLTARAITSTTRSLGLARTGYVSGAGANSRALYRSSATSGSFMGASGYYQIYRVVIGAVSTNMKWFAGFTQSAPAFGTDPNTLTYAVGIGRSGSADANVQLYNNDGGATGTKLDLGASFPHAVDLGYELIVYTLDGSSVGYQVTSINTGAITSGTLATDVLAANISTAFAIFASNDTDAVAVSIDVADIRIWQLAA